MKVNTRQYIEKPPADIFRIVSDFGRWVPMADSDVISMTKQTDGPIGVDTKWVESMKVPGSTIDVDVWITAIDPGRSIDVAFDNDAMRGTGTFTVAPSGDGTDLSMTVDGTVKFWRGWLFYPMIRMDFPKRERNRLAAVKRLAESGELDAANAESASGAEEAVG